MALGDWQFCVLIHPSSCFPFWVPLVVQVSNYFSACVAPQQHHKIMQTSSSTGNVNKHALQTSTSTGSVNKHAMQTSASTGSVNKFAMQTSPSSGSVNIVNDEYVNPTACVCPAAFSKIIAPGEDYVIHAKMKKIKKTTGMQIFYNTHCIYLYFLH